jgi:hypothetical protein
MFFRAKILHDGVAFWGYFQAFFCLFSSPFFVPTFYFWLKKMKFIRQFIVFLASMLSTVIVLQGFIAFSKK